MTSKESTPGTVLLSNTQIATAAELDVYDARGNKIKFGSLFELERTIVVFIRHFFCGNCQQYVSQLATVRSEALESAGTKIVVIGCGDWLLINNYRELTDATKHTLISFYADPTRHLYRAMGLTMETLAITPKDQPRRSYMKNSTLWTNAMKSIMRALKHPLHLGKQGNISQLGGEFIIGPGNKTSFAHHMQHTEDHADVSELFEAAGVAYP